MTTIIIALLTAALTLLAVAVIVLAHANASAARYIEQLELGRDLDTENLQQRDQRIATLTSYNYTLAKRNAQLEWQVDNYICAMPKANRQGALARVREINPN